MKNLFTRRYFFSQLFSFAWISASALILTATIATVGCVKVSNEDKTPTSPDTAAPTTATPATASVPHAPIDPADFDDNLTFQIVPASVPYKYHIVFQWPEFTSPAFVQFKLGTQTLPQLALGQKTFKQDVDHNQTLSYSVTVYDENSESLSAATRTIVIPKDWVVDNTNKDLQGPMNDQIGRLFLSAGSPLTTNGFNLQLKIGEIISSNGVIQTYDEGKIAPAGVEGASGGTIEIESQAATGELKIFMRGGDGGGGFNGAVITDRAPNGTPGGQGQFWSVGSGSIAHLVCRSIGANAGPGQPGHAGIDGTSGMRGGSSGYARFTIQSGADFHYEIQSLPGSGGAPGIGSGGQLGGFPGPVAPPFAPNLNCSGRPSTIVGATGPRGLDGERGPTGAAEMSCIKIVNPARDNCGN